MKRSPIPPKRNGLNRMRKAAWKHFSEQIVKRLTEFTSRFERNPKPGCQKLWRYITFLTELLKLKQIRESHATEGDVYQDERNHRKFAKRVVRLIRCSISYDQVTSLNGSLRTSSESCPSLPIHHHHSFIIIIECSITVQQQRWQKSWGWRR
jgi:hypothetical protein